MSKFKNTAELIDKKLRDSISKDRTRNGTWLATQLSYSPQFIANWKRAVSAPPLEKLKTICLLLDISKKECEDAYINDLKKELKRALR